MSERLKRTIVKNAKARKIDATWTIRAWSELDCEVLYMILKARSAVFVVEQDCPYLDLDGLDKNGIHVLATASDGSVLAYARLLPAGLRFKEPSIGRVLTTELARGQGLGKRLMQRCLDEARQRYPGCSIRISAQQYLQQFYQDLGFVAVSEPYDEDGIAHIEMLVS